MSAVAPSLLSVFARAFKALTDEMSISLQKTTRSPILCEAKDFVTGIYDARGRLVRTLVDAIQPHGSHIQSWNGTNDNGIAVASGVYYVRLQSKGRVMTKKAVLLR